MKYFGRDFSGARAQSGFTLIELIIVMAIMGVLMVAATQMYDSVVKDLRTKGSSFNLYTSLSFARSEAIKRSANVKIAQAGSDWSSGWTVTVVSSGEVLQSQEALSNAVITAGQCTSLSTPVTEIIFTSTGRMSTASQPPCFQIDVSSTATSYVRCTKLELSGNPRTSKGSCS